jgi:hypothetical protein
MPCPVAEPTGLAASPPVTLGAIVRAHGQELTGTLSWPQTRALSAIAACRTAALGGRVTECDRCQRRLTFYNSCRNRACPQCQGLAAARWVEQRQQDLLPVEYFHVVCTIPSELHRLFRFNAAAAYALLFSSAADALLELAADPKHLGAQLGLTAILHTWTQTLAFHPHLHIIVPGGGPSPDGQRWVQARRGFLLPTRALAKLLAGKLLSALEAGLASGRLVGAGETDPRRALKRAARKRWNVYAKPSFAGPEHVIRYLGRYTHRLAISNQRLERFEAGRVTFGYKDRANGDRPCRMTLPALDFLRRYLQHVLPTGFVRIRYYGGLSHPRRKKWLAQSRELLARAGSRPLRAAAPASPKDETWQERLKRLTGIDVTRCPRCGDGTLRQIHELPRPKTSALRIPGPAPPT